MTILEIIHKTQNTLKESRQNSPSPWAGPVMFMHLAEPYPSDVVFQVNRQTTGDGEPCCGLYLILTDRVLRTETSSVDLLEVTIAIIDLFEQFNDVGWTSELLLEAWKNMEFHLHRDPTRQLERPFLHFMQTNTWGDVLQWFTSRAEYYDRPVMKQTIRLPKEDAKKYQEQIYSVFGLNYETEGYDEDAQVACYEVSYGDNWTAELRFRTGSGAEPLYAEVALLYDGRPYGTTIELSNQRLIREYQIPVYDNFVKVVLDVQEEEPVAEGEETEWVIPVTWEMCGHVRVMAHTLEQAIQKADTDESIKLPYEKYYVDGSFAVTDLDPDCIRELYNGNKPDVKRGVEHED